MSDVHKNTTADLNISPKKQGVVKSVGNSLTPANNTQKKKGVTMAVTPTITVQSEEKQHLSIQQQNELNLQKQHNPLQQYHFNEHPQSQHQPLHQSQHQPQQQQATLKSFGVFNPFRPISEQNIAAQHVFLEFQEQKVKWGVTNDIVRMQGDQNQLNNTIQLFSLFLDNNNNLSIDGIREKYNYHQKQLVTLLKYVHEKSSTDIPNGLAAEVEVGVPKLMKICEQSYEGLLCLLRIQEYSNPNTTISDWKNLLKPELDVSKVNSKQKLLLRLYKSLSTEKLRKLDGQCWEEIKTDDGYPTQAYRSVCDIESYIKKKCDRFLDPENWQILTSSNSKNMLGDLEHTLAHVPDIDFPEVTLDRYKFSFRNGIFVIKESNNMGYNKKTGSTDMKYTCKFYPYEDSYNRSSLEGPDPTKSSAKYFKDDFVDYDDEMDWYNIPTPNLHSILDYQFNDRPDCEEIFRMLYALIGRTMFNRGDLENWEIITFIQGMGGSGKSTISKYVLKQFYEISQIAELDNKLEKQFGLGPLAMKKPFITIGDELDEHCQLDLTQFLKMVSGETITAAVKGKTPIYLEWPCHLWFSGNQMPPWEDKGGALSRRIVTIFFKKRVSSNHKDMRLGEKIRREIPNIIQKCVKAYLDLVNKHGHEEFWNFCPKYFNETKDELQQISNVVMRFMRSSEVIYDSSGVVLEKEFLLRLMKFAEENGVRLSTGALRNRNFSINSVIQEINDTNDDVKIEYGRKNVTQKSKQWKNVMALSGIRLKQEEDVNSELFNQDNGPKKLFAFENDFEIQNQLKKLTDAPSELENANSEQDKVNYEDFDAEIMNRSKNTPFELTDDNETPGKGTTLSDGTKLNVDIEYGRYDDDGNLLFKNPLLNS